MPETPTRVIMLATYFPKPLNLLMGNWALRQAQALRRNGIEITVISLTAWVPETLALTKGARAYAACPEWHEWDGLRVFYPRWIWYPVGPTRTLNERYPSVGLNVGWMSVKRKLLDLVREFRPDLIYAHHTAVNGYVATRIKESTGLSFLVTDHDFGEIEACRKYPIRRSMFHEVIRESSGMIAVSRRMESEVRSQFPSARACTIPNGADPVSRSMLESPRPPELRGRLVVFSCGTFYPRKGFPVLIDAFASIARKYPDVVLRIAGDGEQKAEIEERIRQNGLEHRVSLLGSLPHSSIIQEMVWCDVFALIGWDEPFATVYLEALSAGKPVVCCSDGGITDCLRDGEHGFTVPPRDAAAAGVALDRLLGHERLRNQFGESALRLFESSLTWDRHASRMIELFSGVLNRRAAIPQ
uniref:Glycosyl transferase, group 1 n=1 Tax=Solibacter usitatus (strain Ellin6076) TaxID=234267 RepID=Q01XK3_SOLUE